MNVFKKNSIETLKEVLGRNNEIIKNIVLIP